MLVKIFSRDKNPIAAISEFLSKNLAASRTSSSWDFEGSSKRSQNNETFDTTELILFSASEAVLEFNVKFVVSALARVSLVT